MSLREFTFEDINRRLLGVLALVGVALLLAGAFAVGSLGLLEDRVRMTGTFSDISGLRVGSTVHVAGIEVGKVTAFDPDFEQGHVVVTWEIDRDVDLGPETRAEIATSTLFGGHHIRLSGPVVEPHLQANAHIPLERTRSAVGVVEAIDRATRTIEGVNVTLVNDVAGLLATVAANTRGQFDGLFENLQEVTGALVSREAELERLLSSGETIIQTLEDKDQELFRLMDAADVLLRELTVREDVLRRVLGDGTEAVEALSGVIADNRANLDALVGDLGFVLGSLNDNLDDLDRTLALIGPTFAGFATAYDPVHPWVNFVITTLGPFATGPGAQGGSR